MAANAAAVSSDFSAVYACYSEREPDREAQHGAGIADDLRAEHLLSALKCGAIRIIARVGENKWGRQKIAGGYPVKRCRSGTSHNVVSPVKPDRRVDFGQYSLKLHSGRCANRLRPSLKKRAICESGTPECRVQIVDRFKTRLLAVLAGRRAHFSCHAINGNFGCRCPCTSPCRWREPTRKNWKILSTKYTPATNTRRSMSRRRGGLRYWPSPRATW